MHLYLLICDNLLEAVTFFSYLTGYLILLLVTYKKQWYACILYNVFDLLLAACGIDGDSNDTIGK